MTSSVYKLFVTLLAVATPYMAVSGGENERPLRPQSDAACHSHSPIIKRSRPVIERLPLRVVDPVDVAVSEFGETLVADRIGKVVFHIDALGEASLLAKNLDGLSRLVYSKTYGPHALLAAKGSGRIMRITETGYQSETHLRFRPAGLGVDNEGRLLTTDKATGDVWQIDSEGKQSVLYRLPEPTKDLVVDSLGTAVVLLQSGKVFSVFSNETTPKPEGWLPPSTTRIAMDPNGGVVGLATDADGKSVLLRPGSKRGEHDRFGKVPQGTAAFAFDQLGNLTMAIPDLRAITRVTSHFLIPCPACGRMVPLVFSPDAPLQNHKNVRSF